MDLAMISALTSGQSANSNQSSAIPSTNDQIMQVLLSKQSDPKFASLLLNQMAENNVNSILFGNQNSNGTTTGNSDVFGNLSTSDILGTQNNFDALGQSTSSSGITPEFQLSVFSTLIGKKVTAINPLTGQQVTDTVKGVTLKDGKVALDINGAIVPTENLVSITQ